MGAPPGLILYSEYPVAADEMRHSLLFLGEIETADIHLKKAYNDLMWVHDDQLLPRDMIPQVRAAFPYALMAAGMGFARITPEPPEYSGRGSNIRAPQAKPVNSWT